MKKTIQLCLSLIVPLAALALAPAASAQRPLVRVAPPADMAVQDDAFDEREWSAQLRSEDLAARRAAYDALVERALHDEDARAAVRRWAADDGDVELAWTAELLLRELEQAQARTRSPFARLRPRFSLTPGDEDGPERVFERLRRQLDDSFADLDFGAPLGGDLNQWFDALQSGLPLGGKSSSQGTRVEIGPDGVHVEVRTEEDGDEHVETYDADSIEALLEAHPELESKIGTQLSPGPLGRAPLFGGLRTPSARPNALAPLPPGGGGNDSERWKPGRTRTDVLGVRVRAPQDRTQPIDGVADDVGLEVVQVLPHTIAAALALEPGDVVLSIDGREAKSVDDVRAALEARSADAAVTIEIRARDGARSTRTWEPEHGNSVLF